MADRKQQEELLKTFMAVLVMKYPETHWGEYDRPGFLTSVHDPVPPNEQWWQVSIKNSIYFTAKWRDGKATPSVSLQGKDDDGEMGIQLVGEINQSQLDILDRRIQQAMRTF